MANTKWIVRDGLRIRVGGRLWRWYRRNKGSLKGNPALNDLPPSKRLEQTKAVVAWAHTSLHYAGRMNYTESGARSMLFHRRPGDFAGASADCSQYVSALLHWIGVKQVTDTDNTGSLLRKGRPEKFAAVGRVAVWGPGDGDHAAFITEKAPGAGWWTTGFGHPGAPDRVLLTDMNAYFTKIGKPGVRYRDFFA